MTTNSEQPVEETLDIGSDTSAILQASIEPMRVPALLAGAIGGTVLLVIFTAALVSWVRRRPVMTPQ
jgi:uncharacterized protein (DUF2062 family)